MNKIALLFLFQFSILSANSQLIRGELYLCSHVDVVEHYTKDGQVNLESIRATTHLLTNRDIQEFEGILLPKRKKAFVRHVKHISEVLEEYHFDERNVDSMALELIVELEYLRQSFVDKGMQSINGRVTFKEQMKMAIDTRRSLKICRYPITQGEVNPPSDSPYWHNVEGLKYEEFGDLERQKKIKAHKEMMVVFKGLSYTGSAPKIRTFDADLDNEWCLKWGDELHSDVVGSRLFAALGYDVDHPYHYQTDQLTLVFDGSSSIENWKQLVDSVYLIYSVDISSYLSQKGDVNESMVSKNNAFAAYLGKPYVKFVKCAVEARPDRVKRLGSFLADSLSNDERKVLRGSVLAHAWIGNWDTRSANTLLTTVHNGEYQYQLSGVFSDLGTSFGVRIFPLARDFRVGLVNSFEWEVALKKYDEIRLLNPINAILKPYENANYLDLKWMAQMIAQMDSLTIRKCLVKAKWPNEIEELYFHKLASRRASILKAFDIVDPHPISFNKSLSILKNGEFVVKNGKLKKRYNRKEHPEGFRNKKGRKRNYGN